MRSGLPGAARQTRHGDIAVEQPEIRATNGRARQTSGYLTIRNSGAAPDQLYYVASECADRIELHTHQMAGGVGSRVRLPSITVPARGQVRLAPGGPHLRFVGLKQRLVAGTEQTLLLTFARAGRIDASFAVQNRIAGRPVRQDLPFF